MDRASATRRDGRSQRMARPAGSRAALRRGAGARRRQRRRSPDVVLAIAAEHGVPAPRHRHRQASSASSVHDFNDVDAHRRAARAARRRVSRSDSPDHGPVRARRAVAYGGEIDRRDRSPDLNSCAASSEFTAIPTRRTSRSSACTRCSIADRNRSASCRSTTPDRRAPCAAWARCPTRSSQELREDPRHVGRRPHALQHAGSSTIENAQPVVARSQGRLHHARAQRQPDQRRRAAPRARGARGRSSPRRTTPRSSSIGSRAPRPTTPAERLADALQRRRRRVQPDRRDGRHAARRARSARLAAARHGPARRRRRLRVRDLRARHRRRDVSSATSSRARSSSVDGNGVQSIASAAEAGSQALRVRVRVLRAPRQPRLRRLGRPRAPRARPAARAASIPRRAPISCSACPIRRTPRRSASPRRAACPTSSR